MALTAANVLEVRTGSGVSDNNGGAFDPTSAGTDRSQQNSPQVAIDNSTITTSITTNVITFTGNTYTVLAGDVGNVVQMLTGTNVTPAFYRITSVSAGLNGSWTVDSNVVTAGTTTNATGNMGGALASPGKAAGAMVSGNALYCASGTYSFTSTSSNVAAGMCSFPAGLTANQTFIQGYGSSRGDGGTKPLWQASGSISTFTMVTLAADCHVENVSIDGASKTSSRGVSISGAGILYQCKLANFTNNAMTGNTTFLMRSCELTGCSTQRVVATCNMQLCSLHDNTVNIFTGSDCAVSDCIFVNNSGATSDAMQVSASGRIANCTFYNNGRHGISVTASANQVTISNCIFYNNGGWGVTANAAADGVDVYTCAFLTNTSGDVNTTSAITAGHVNGKITLTADPFTNKTGNDFSLNNTSGGGALLRGLSAGGVFGGLSTTSFMDIGAAQSQGGSGSVQGFVYIRGR